MNKSHIEKMKDKLFPKEIAERLPKIGTSKSIKLLNKKVVARYYFLDGSLVLYVFEGDKKTDNDILFYCAFEQHDPSSKDIILVGVGHFMLSQLCASKDSFNTSPQRDKHYTQAKWTHDCKISELDTLTST